MPVLYRKNAYAYDADKNSVSALIRDERLSFANAALDANDIWLIDFFRLIRIDSAIIPYRNSFRSQRRPTQRASTQSCAMDNQIGRKPEGFCAASSKENHGRGIQRGSR
jgi:hypothetical protein